jgi:hypothetical protein
MMFPMKFGYIILKYDGQRGSVKSSIISQVSPVVTLLPKLTVKWPNFRLIKVSTDYTINVSAKISITPFQAYILRAILEESYCAHILTSTARRINARGLQK